jgi:hypothetical protein
MAYLGNGERYGEGFFGAAGSKTRPQNVRMRRADETDDAGKLEGVGEVEFAGSTSTGGG